MESNIHVNLGVKLATPGRKAEIITKEDFIRELEAKYYSHAMERCIDVFLSGGCTKTNPTIEDYYYFRDNNRHLLEFPSHDLGIFLKYFLFKDLSDIQTRHDLLLGFTYRGNTYDEIYKDFQENYHKSNLVDRNRVLKDIKKVTVNWERICAGTFDTQDKGGGSIDKCIRVTSSGIPFLYGEVGGEWEAPVLFIIYYDGKSFRGYFPTHGNCFNKKTKSAFGNDEDADIEFLTKEGIDVFSPDFSFISMRPDYEECFKDFESRIIAVN